MGTAKIYSSSKVEVTAEDGSKLVFDTSKILIATGSEPTPLPNVEFDEKRVLSSTGALEINKIPEHLVVVGGGYIG